MKHRGASSQAEDMTGIHAVDETAGRVIVAASFRQDTSAVSPIEIASILLVHASSRSQSKSPINVDTTRETGEDSSLSRSCFSGD